MKLNKYHYYFCIVCIFLLSTNVFARFEIQTSTAYTSTSDGKTKNTFSDMTNFVFIGATLDTTENMVIGNHVGILSNALKATNNNTISITEIGPRVNYYFNAEHTLYTAISWTPYSKGKRKANGGASEDISGWGYMVGLGAALKITKQFYLGASVNYHSLTVTESVVGTTSTKTTDNYTSILPMINMTFRFR